MGKWESQGVIVAPCEDCAMVLRCYVGRARPLASAPLDCARPPASIRTWAKNPSHLEMGLYTILLFDCLIDWIAIAILHHFICKAIYSILTEDDPNE